MLPPPTHFWMQNTLDPGQEIVQTVACSLKCFRRAARIGPGPWLDTDGPGVDSLHRAALQELIQDGAIGHIPTAALDEMHEGIGSVFHL